MVPRASVVREQSTIDGLRDDVRGMIVAVVSASPGEGDA
jgi:hypothetical protein